MTGLHGIILAGGISSRMGAPKAFMPVGESFALHAIYEKLAASGAAPVHIVVNTGLLRLLQVEMGRFANADFVSNAEPALGQLHSLKRGFRAARKAGAGGALVALVDLPWVSQETVRILTARARELPEKIIIPSFETRHGHPIVVPASLFDNFLMAEPPNTGRDVVRSLRQRIDYLEVGDPFILRDVDSPADLGWKSPEKQF